MTLSEAAKGVMIEPNQSYNIGFNGDDETQFTADDFQDLQGFWKAFCSENQFDENNVDYVERADTDNE